MRKRKHFDAGGQKKAAGTPLLVSVAPLQAREKLEIGEILNIHTEKRINIHQKLKKPRVFCRNRGENGTFPGGFIMDFSRMHKISRTNVLFEMKSQFCQLLEYFSGICP